ncbi:hypothetical protein CJ010_19205 [Azoarcus sp. DD4]|uniref:nitrous oxide reductase accessory protein NosL n=1 Tax=Azoarcus sp. DD4 TaxID=2027405 RepID=UPI001128CA5E|nr:nitrous oxide reductase accessory protein NosL [Azoarcus sp. DD4]QDF98512.1 hypothetical protein CJ010_19205 [Azoarcus sp. DD4]
MQLSRRLPSLRLPVRRIGLLSAAVCVLAGAAYAWSAHKPAAEADAALPPDVCIVRPGAPFPGAVHAYDPASGLAMLAARPVPAHARCAVCGMFPARHPDWAAQLITDNGDAWFFDSPVDMLLFLADSARYTRGIAIGAIAARYVSDHAGGGWVAADEAWFVHGSSATGPMRGPDLPAFASRAAAEALAAAQGGRVLRFAELDATLVAALRQTYPAH